jgi:hypothetical protein
MAAGHQFVSGGNENYDNTGRSSGTCGLVNFSMTF